jgi:hypothetical protein
MVFFILLRSPGVHNVIFDNLLNGEECNGPYVIVQECVTSRHAKPKMLLIIQLTCSIMLRNETIFVSVTVKSVLPSHKSNYFKFKLIVPGVNSPPGNYPNDRGNAVCHYNNCSLS